MHHKFTNRLIDETSPYLLQHAHNPVDWFPWGEEALLKAKTENKVILVSIGYSACHWCHVMERESFENEQVAQLMNGHFVNIKIDREERPDLDHIYMDAVQAISGSGGWPLNVFLTPDAKPFFGGTYFPPAKAYNRPGWADVLNGIAQSWKERKNEVESQADNLTDYLQKSNSFAAPKNILSTLAEKDFFTIEQCDSMFSAIMKSADTRWGGFGNAPKFPQTFTIQYLLQYHYFTGNKEALKQGLLSIDKMIMGGIYDHIGGGLARYSTDNEWLAPHFEKMLYDNALLINVLCDAYQITSEKKYEDAIRKTILFITSELLNAGGGFYAALDADSEGEEGKYYVWQKEEVDKILGDDSVLFCAYFDITEEGNWEEKNILRILKPIEDFANERDVDKDQLRQTFQRCLVKLSLQRDKRIKPSLDDKIILGWNALMLRAITRASIVLKDQSLKDLAEENILFLQRSLTIGKESPAMYHTYKNGIGKYPAFLDDYVYWIATFIELYTLTFKESYLQTAHEYCKYVIDNFSDEENVFFFFTNKEQKDVVVRKKEIYDGATPSGNAIMAGNLYKLAIYFDRADWRERADKMLETVLSSVIKYPGSFGIWASLVLQQKFGISEIAVVGSNFASVSNNILLKFIPNIIMMAAETENNAFPLLANRPKNESTMIYFCRNYSCLTPFSNVNSLWEKMDVANKKQDKDTIL